jgi:hypothetical protein
MNRLFIVSLVLIAVAAFGGVWTANLDIPPEVIEESAVY